MVNGNVVENGFAENVSFAIFASLPYVLLSFAKEAHETIVSSRFLRSESTQ